MAALPDQVPHSLLTAANFLRVAMPIVLKTRREIEMMRRAGQLGFQILSKMRDAALAGVTTMALDELAHRELANAGAIGLSRNYPTYKAGEGFPGYTCISVNEEVVHGIPGNRVLKNGDVVTLDLALSLNDLFECSALTANFRTNRRPLSFRAWA